MEVSSRSVVYSNCDTKKGNELKTPHIILLKELITMELVVGLLSFVGEITTAWAISAWSYYQEKLGNN
jgi:hypothetical protein